AAAAAEGGRGGPRLSIVALDSARRLGAKILVAGGGRCNVTHAAVDESAFAGSTRPAIRKVLGRFGVERTVGFFRDLGVELKREQTGKLFPTTDDAHTVLDALLRAAAEAGVELRHPWRAASVERTEGGFLITPDAAAGGAAAALRADRIILATGGRALPRSGSDGAGYAFAAALGHSFTPRIFPALVPLTLPRDHFLCALAGIAAPATLEVRSGAGKRLAAFTNATLCTHFGLSGPAVLDISRYYTDAAAMGPGATLVINWLTRAPAAAAPGGTPDHLREPVSPEEFDRDLQDLARRSPSSGLARFLAERLPERLARALLQSAAVAPSTPTHRLTREQRLAVVRAVTALPLPITGDRGFTHAEVTAGGIPLSEVRLETMESRLCPGLFLCGEILDVDGRIGGFNFQWAWASGFIAGRRAAGWPGDPGGPG
ncbi:MAG: aminoacetone oxidase family FAD-binding enzyme, partial [Phycisphaerales bacterium]